MNGVDWASLKELIQALAPVVAGGVLAYTLLILPGRVNRAVTDLNTAGETLIKRVKEIQEKIEQNGDNLETLLKKDINRTNEAIEMPLKAQGDISPPADVESTTLASSNWEQLREYWRSTKEIIEQVVEGSDGRSRAKYNRMTRYDYAKLAELLRDDGYLPEPAPVFVRHLQDLFNLSRRDTRAVTAETVAEARDIHEKILALSARS